MPTEAPSSEADEENSLWRPLHGPNDDWPLVVCDFSSIEERDMILNDDLHRDRAVENTLLHSNEKHRWHYIGGQAIEDVLIFRIIDSTGRRARKCFNQTRWFLSRCLSSGAYELTHAITRGFPLRCQQPVCATRSAQDEH